MNITRKTLEAVGYLGFGMLLANDGMLVGLSLAFVSIYSDPSACLFSRLLSTLYS